MRISYIYDLELPSRTGAAIQILNTCRALCEHGVATDVWVRRIDGSADACLRHHRVEPHPSLRLRTLPTTWRGGVDVAALRHALTGSRREERHVVISRGEPGIGLIPALARSPNPTQERWVYEAHRLCFTYPVAERDPPPRGVRRIGAWVKGASIRRREAATLARVDGTVFLTRGVREAVRAEFGGAGPELILPSGARPPHPAAHDDAGREIDVVYAGKLERRKGVDDLLAAMRHLPGRQVWLIGGTEEQLQSVSESARRLGVDGSIVQTGYLPPGDVETHLLRARVGVCPLPAGMSRIAERFTSPLKIMEMMALGTPIVATGVPSVREILTDGHTALLAPPNDPRALAAAVERLLSDRVLAATLARNARREVERFSWSNRARRLLDFAESLP